MFLLTSATSQTATRAAPRRSTIKPPDRCPHCNSKRLIKKGTRKKKLEDVPLFRCRACGRTFAPGPRAIREGQRVLFRLLNASPTENITLSLPGHRLTVIALDGNPVPARQSVDTLFLAPAERADVIVEMNRPGVWILGGIKDEDRKMGLGVVVEYANQRGEPQWSPPPDSQWDYGIFGQNRQLPSPDERLDLLFEKVPGGHGGYNRWTINGKSWPNINPLFTTETGKRYRLAMTNKSGDNHPVHLHRHSFEVSKIGEKQPRA
jgi:FtsP/CotA-like multicopper oxidase with cupredoxin domain